MTIKKIRPDETSYAHASRRVWLLAGLSIEEAILSESCSIIPIQVASGVSGC
jgi:hypothetical protein